MYIYQELLHAYLILSKSVKKFKENHPNIVLLNLAMRENFDKTIGNVSPFDFHFLLVFFYKSENGKSHRSLVVMC